jgi:hypothetical protein
VAGGGSRVAWGFRLWLYTLATSGPHSYSDDHRLLVSRVLVRVREVVNKRFTVRSLKAVSREWEVPASGATFHPPAKEVKRVFALSFKCVKVEELSTPHAGFAASVSGLHVAVASPPPVREAFLVHRTCWVQVLTRPGFGPAPSDHGRYPAALTPVYPAARETKTSARYFSYHLALVTRRSPMLDRDSIKRVAAAHIEKKANEARWFAQQLEQANQILHDAVDVADAPDGLSDNSSAIAAAVVDIRRNISKAIDRHAKAAARVRMADGPLTKRQVAKILKDNKIDGEVSGSGTRWSVELKNDAARRRFEKVLPKGTGLGGYRTGYGGWVLDPHYKSMGDFNDPSSRHHYAATKRQVSTLVTNRWKRLNDHLRIKGDLEGRSLLDDLADAIGL